MTKTTVPTISLCAIVRNERHLLGQCLASIKSLVNEIIIVDTGSTDGTQDIALSFAAKVFEYKWNDDFSAARNFSLSKATSDWILILDADEAIDECDHSTIRAHTRYPTHCYRLTQRHYSNDAVMSGFIPKRGQYAKWEKDYIGYFESDLVRLIPNKLGLLYRERIHELLEYALNDRVDLKVLRSPVPIHHFGHTPEVKARKQKSLLYTNLGETKYSASPASAQAARELGIEHINNKQFAEAVTALSRSAELEASNLTTWVNLGYALCELGDLERARQALESALKIDARSEEAFCNLGVVHLRARVPEKAENYFRNALIIKPDYLNAQSNLALALAMQGRLSEAAFQFTELIDKAPGLEKPRLELAKLYATIGID